MTDKSLELPTPYKRPGECIHKAKDHYNKKIKEKQLRK